MVGGIVGLKLRLVYTQENFPWIDNFSLSCELPCTTNDSRQKKFTCPQKIFLSVNGPLACRQPHDILFNRFTLIKEDVMGLSAS